MSIGVAAEVPGLRLNSRRLIESADIQLCRAKRTGRNRVMASGAG